VTWTLRRATTEDAAVMAETVAIGFDGYREFAPPGWRPPDVQTAVELARIRARLDDEDTWAEIAEDRGLVAGHLGFFPQRALPGTAHLWQLFLRPPWWGSGLAAELLHRALEAAAARGLRRMRLYTPRDQARARGFYEREGFAHTGWEGYEEPIRLVLVEYARDGLRRSASGSTRASRPAAAPTRFDP
jgi:GNAT superfamily N-acetyltransferase